MAESLLESAKDLLENQKTFNQSTNEFLVGTGIESRVVSINELLDRAASIMYLKSVGTQTLQRIDHLRDILYIKLYISLPCAC